MKKCVQQIAENKHKDDIMRGYTKRSAPRFSPLCAAQATRPYMMTGGVVRNQGLARALADRLGTKLIISDNAQLCGTIGAALFSMNLEKAATECCPLFGTYL